MVAILNHCQGGYEYRCGSLLENEEYRTVLQNPLIREVKLKETITLYKNSQRRIYSTNWKAYRIF